LQATVENILGVQREDVAEVGIGFDEAFVVQRAEKVLSFSLPVAFGGVDVSDESHGLSSVSSKLGLGLPDFLHVFESMIALNGVLFLNSVGLPRVRRRVVLGS
jgi:hypothetical protein